MMELGEESVSSVSMPLLLIQPGEARLGRCIVFPQRYGGKADITLDSIPRPQHSISESETIAICLLALNVRFLRLFYF